MLLCVWYICALHAYKAGKLCTWAACVQVGLVIDLTNSKRYYQCEDGNPQSEFRYLPDSKFAGENIHCEKVLS